MAKRRISAPGIVLATALGGVPVQATTGDDGGAAYIATCETAEICRETSGCIEFPTFGRLHLSITGPTGQLGPNPDDPRPLDVYHGLDSTPPDPETLGLRFIVEQQAQDPLTRRFAYVDQTRAGPAGRYFMLDCTEVPQ
ncbi:hypothetical protein HKCCE4037_02545 [Rhodobacterales bacterium HKCCE4037]|nr:hypothetical protein [Rhodobacterales bacterium HKCCE4037]